MPRSRVYSELLGTLTRLIAAIMRIETVVFAYARIGVWLHVKTTGAIQWWTSHEPNRRTYQHS